tara:strand:- start:132 stop:1463 length:1332 start_codon:yes stop_codon:yes gene_type:complete
MNQPAKEINEPKPKICLIGVGDTGVKLVETLAMVAPEEVEAYSLDTDSRSLTRCHQSRTILLGQAIPCGLGTGGDSALARAAVKSDKKALLDLVEGTDLVFILTGLGGGTGTGAAPFIADLAKRAGALVVGVAASPFDCEGVQRANQAIGGLRDLKQVADAVFHFPNEDILRMEGDQLSLNRALDIANRHLCEAVLGVSRMLLESGMLNVSFADIQALLRDRHSLGVVVHIESVGEDRADDLIRKLLIHPSIRGGDILEESKNILVYISGGGTTLEEMNTITASIRSHASSAGLVIGASSEENGESLQLTIIMAQAGKLAGEYSEPSISKGDSLGLVVSDNITVPGAGSYLELANETESKSRGTFAYTPPAPTADTLTPECRKDLIREAAREEPNRTKRRKIIQEQLPLEIVSKGRFENSEPTIHQGEDLDQPTYIRRGTILN